MTDNCLLGLDIGVGSVKACVFHLEKKEEGKKIIIARDSRDMSGISAVIIGFGEAKINKPKSRQESEKEIVRACYLAKKEAENMAGVVVDKAIIGATARFIKCSTNIFDFTRERPEKIISLFEIKNLLQRAQWKIFDKIRQKEDVESGVFETEIRLLSGEIAGIKIGNYSVVDPIGFEGKELTIAILNTYSSKSFLKIIQALNKFLGIEILSLAPFNRAVLEAISEHLLKAGNLGEASCFIVDCGDRTTDISVAHKGFFIGPKAVGMGGSSFSRYLAAKFNLSEQEGEKLKIRYIAGDLSAQIKRKVTDALSGLFNVWYKGIEEIIVDLSKTLSSLPHAFFIYGGGSLLGGFKKKLENPEWQKKFKFEGPIKIKEIKIEHFNRVEDRTGLLGKPDRIRLLALASFSLKLTRKETELNSILNRVIRLMQN